MQIDVVSLFPGALQPRFSKRASWGARRRRALVRVRTRSPRDFGIGTPSQGRRHAVRRRLGHGHARRLLVACMESLDARPRGRRARAPRAHDAARAQPLVQASARALAREARRSCSSAAATKASTSACARFVDEEISLGDFVLTGGEVAAMAVIEAIVRLFPACSATSERRTKSRTARERRAARVPAVHAPRRVPRRTACPRCSWGAIMATSPTGARSRRWRGRACGAPICYPMPKHPDPTLGGGRENELGFNRLGAFPHS